MSKFKIIKYQIKFYFMFNLLTYRNPLNISGNFNTFSFIGLTEKIFSVSILKKMFLVLRFFLFLLSIFFYNCDSLNNISVIIQSKLEIWEVSGTNNFYVLKELCKLFSNLFIFLFFKILEILKNLLISSWIFFFFFSNKIHCHILFW